MAQAKNKKDRFYNILVFGIEKKGLTEPAESLSSRNFCLHFEPYNTHRRFNDFDGVIAFQGIFENSQWKSGMMGDYLTHSCDRNALDKRKKEALLLLQQGGVLCFLLNESFIDTHNGQNFEGDDLTKCHLNYSQLYRTNFDQRLAYLHVLRDEFRPFLELYGAASSYFQHYNTSIEWHDIARIDIRTVGMIIDRLEYFVPTLVPDNRPEVIEEYFTLLADAVTSTYNKLHQELPTWINEFEFSEENELKQELELHEDRISEISDRLDHLRQRKSVLVLTGDELVFSVIKIFRQGFKVAVDATDEFREDCKLLGDDDAPFCLCEVKGTNRGLKREHINQADSHRERSGLPGQFPTVLIINTNIKNARSVGEKDQEIAHEQVQHARKMNVLILRTLDLLELLRSHLGGNISTEAVKEILASETGWLRVDKKGYTVISGDEPANGE